MKRYWLRGMIFVPILAIVAGLFGWFLGYVKISKPIYNCFRAPCPSPWLGIKFFEADRIDFSDIYYFFSHLVIVFAVLLIIGAIVGWLYGKIRGTAVTE